MSQEIITRKVIEKTLITTCDFCNSKDNKPQSCDGCRRDACTNCSTFQYHDVGDGHDYHCKECMIIRRKYKSEIYELQTKIDRLDDKMEEECSNLTKGA